MLEKAGGGGCGGAWRVSAALQLLLLLVLLCLPPLTAGRCPGGCDCNLNPRPSTRQQEPTITCVGNIHYRPYHFRQVYSLHLYKELRLMGFSQRALVSGTFYGMGNVSRVVISDCQLEYIADKAFAELGPALEHLYVERCNMEHIEPGALHNLTHVEHVKFSHCTISTLVKRSFAPSPMSGSSHIRHLVLHRCRINIIATHAFAGVQQADSIVVKNGTIGEVSVGGFGLVERSVKVLSILRNNITHIATRAFRGSQAENVQLFANNIVSFAEGCFEDLREGAATLHGMRTVTIASNNFTCDCHLLWILGDDSAVDIEWNKCGSPERFRGKFLDRIDIHRRCRGNPRSVASSAPSGPAAVVTNYSACTGALLVILLQLCLRPRTDQ